MIAAVVASLALVPGVVSAQGNAPGIMPDPTLPAGKTPDVLSHVSFEQRLDQQLPLELPFKDEQGRSVKLGEYFGRKPVVLTFAATVAGPLAIRLDRQSTAAVKRSSPITVSGPESQLLAEMPPTAD